MAKSKKKKRKAAQARAKHRAQVEKRRARTRHSHLPKVGTPENDAYRLEHSRRDALSLGMAPMRKGALNWIVVLLVVGAMILGTVGLIIINI